MTKMISDKKTALLAYKEEILRDIKYFEKRVEEALSAKSDSICFDDDGSDSDTDIMLNTGQSISHMTREMNMLQTCLQATQELTNLHVLQSEVNVMVNDPAFERQPPVSELGVWREVTADCRIDVVPFTITFYVHQPSRLFGPLSYRSLTVTPVKAAHEQELAKSILLKVDTPSDAVEVLRSYSVAYRSRRTTLARLAEKYPASLYMEPMANGGYVLKCADLLEVSWTLENRWSPVAPFHHRMKFDLEYMDEAYVKIISQAHRELSDPALGTDERTRLMAKIIATCLEARGPTQELYESMESDVESENLRKRRMTLDQEIEESVHKNKDSEVMAPPKSLPKKTKPKGKENNVDNKNIEKATKRKMMDDKANGGKVAKHSKGNPGKTNVTNAENDESNKETVNPPKTITENTKDSKVVAASSKNKDKVGGVKPMPVPPKPPTENEKVAAKVIPANIKSKNKVGGANPAVPHPKTARETEKAAVKVIAANSKSKDKRSGVKPVVPRPKTAIDNENVATKLIAANSKSKDKVSGVKPVEAPPKTATENEKVAAKVVAANSKSKEKLGGVKPVVARPKTATENEKVIAANSKSNDKVGAVNPIVNPQNNNNRNNTIQSKGVADKIVAGINKETNNPPKSNKTSNGLHNSNKTNVSESVSSMKKGIDKNKRPLAANVGGGTTNRSNAMKDYKAKNIVNKKISNTDNGNAQIKYISVKDSTARNSNSRIPKKIPKSLVREQPVKRNPLRVTPKLIKRPAPK